MLSRLGAYEQQYLRFERSNALPDGILGELGKIVYLQFLHDADAMRLDRFYAYLA